MIRLVFAGDALNNCEAFFRPASLSEYNAESHALEARSRSPNSDEPKCGSPTVISCSELSQSEKENREGGNAPAFNDVDGIANKVESISHDPKGNDVSEDDRSFTFEVSSLADLSDRETGKGWKPFPIIQPYELPQTVEDSPSTTSRGIPRVSDGENVRSSSKSTPERKKTRRVSVKATERETAKAGKPIKEINSVRQTTERGAKSCNVSPNSIGTTTQVLQAEKMGSYEYVEGSSMKPCVVPTIQTSNLPDLNTSASPSALFQQPFTDLQQVQLRAQIFVYGSLIQGTAPDEACMISAFGESEHIDAGRSAWENVWRVTVEKLHNQKSPLSILETPPHLRSGSRVAEQTIRQSSLQSKALPTPVDRTGSKGTPSAIINPVIPLSSPLWNISTPHDGLQFSSIPRGLLLDSHQALSPLHPYQSPHIRNYIGHNTHWLSQPPCPGPWVVSPQTSAVDTGAHYSALPITEAVHVTSVRESSVPRPSSIQHVPPSPLVHNGGGSMSVFAGTAPLLDAKKATVSTGKHASADPKPRKRRKNPASEELSQICSLDQTYTEPVSGAGVTSNLSASRAIITPANSASKTTPGNFIAAVSTISSTQYQLVGGRDTEQKAIYLEETCSKIEQAKLQAEDAAALAAAAVRHSQGIWSQLDKQKDSGLVSDVEAKLASAAVAVAAAASVAKAAAAAAKVASDAALQAKLMADEALVLSRTGNPTQSTETCVSDSVTNLGKLTPALILTGKDRTNSSSSIIVAAREVARRRVEAASAATKRAENLDAIVKAAGLAAEAVSQAGTIIAMGDPIPLSVSELIEAGPEGYWKVQEVSSEQLVKSNNINRGEQSNMDGVEGLDASPKHLNDRSSNKKETQTIYQGKPSPPKEMSRQSVENHMGLVNGMQWDSAKSIEKGLAGQKGRKASELAKTIGVVPESETGSRSASITVQNEEYKGHQPVGTSNENSIREGSHVEVLSDKDDLRRVWFSAKVLSLKDGKANVCYTDEGSRQLKEWVSLEGEGDKEPKIRIARPMTAMKFEGTRKRRREAMGNYASSVGERVDARIRDGGVADERIGVVDGTSGDVLGSVLVRGQDVGAWSSRQSSGKSFEFNLLQHQMRRMERRYGFRGLMEYDFQDSLSVSSSQSEMVKISWWEGIITEKSKEDETTLTVHFPAQGVTSIVSAWHLRPSFIWKDGQWMEWSSPRENISCPHEDDTRQEKRLKVVSHEAEINPAVETRRKDNLSKNIGIEESDKPEEFRSLALSAKEKIFNVGTSIREENKPDTLRMRRTGLQKEGSRVIFGVPKPGKKRKFMEVSKHYVADRSDKINEGKDSTKFSKFLIPQGPGTRGWKNTFKIDSKEKGTAESKPKVPKSVKTRSVPSRSIPQKDSSLTCVIPASNDGTVQDHLPNVGASVGLYEIISEKQPLIEVGSFPKTRKTADGPLLFSSLALPSDAPRKQSSSPVEAERVNRGKLAPSGEKLARIEEKDSSQNDHPGKSILDVVEPRRSNRRMQPTSRVNPSEFLRFVFLFSIMFLLRFIRAQMAEQTGKLLQLSLQENNKVIELDGDPLQADLSKFVNSLVGCLLSDRPYSLAAAKSTIIHSWKPQEDVQVVELLANLLLFKFQKREDLLKVKRFEPWVFNNHLLLLRDWVPDLSPHEIIFDDTLFWIQLHGLPSERHTHQVGLDLGSEIGIVLEVDVHTGDGSKGKFIRIRVIVAMSLLIRHQMLSFLMPLLIKVCYERLPSFCYHCGILGHEFKYCATQSEELPTYIDHPVDPWLRADYFRPR
ncbi:hypothetical protein HHK36_028645 [Tetracentron sinense]|uniref:Agenet domain-containing protein n=1 Tax=Tetracentron sinense TaxID=13715 RepID=A0A834YHR7_TETSI|nr:hypothetical protein HHK36_028645 [Tetracentron sinense]